LAVTGGGSVGECDLSPADFRVHYNIAVCYKGDDLLLSKV